MPAFPAPPLHVPTVVSAEDGASAGHFGPDDTRSVVDMESSAASHFSDDTRSGQDIHVDTSAVPVPEDATGGGKQRFGVPIVADHVEDPDRHFAQVVQNLLTHMTGVELEMSYLKMYIRTQAGDDKPMSQWPRYTGYEALSNSVEQLDLTVDSLGEIAKEAYFDKSFVTAYVIQARAISTTVSNATAFVLKVMSEETAEYVLEWEDSLDSTPIHETVRAAIASDLGKLMQHSTAATHSVWAAMDFLQTIPSKISTNRAGNTNAALSLVNAMTWKDWVIMGVMTWMLCLGVKSFHHHGPLGVPTVPQLSTMNSTGAAIYTAFSDMKTVCNLVNKNINLANQAQDARFAEFNQRYRIIEEAARSNSDRIDNVWEALGPPNENGTYYPASGASESGACLDEKSLSKYYEALSAQMKKVEASAKEVKKEYQRTEVRLSSRMKYLERKVR